MELDDVIATRIKDKKRLVGSYKYVYACGACRKVIPVAMTGMGY